MVPQARLAALGLALPAALLGQAPAPSSATAPAPSPAPTWEELEARGARLAAVRIEVQPVFDLSDPAQDNWIGRLGNHLHRDTRPRVIARELPFQAGDPVDARQIHETERRLRSFRSIKDAAIVPELGPKGAVTAIVRARDAWTLKASVGYSQVGGRHSWSFGLQDQNLLGTGKALTLRRQVDPDRTSNAVVYADRQLFGSDWALTADYQSLSDGRSRSLSLGRPFKALDTPWSFTLEASSLESRVLVFDRNAQIYEAPERLTHGRLEIAARVGGSATSALRLGLSLEAADAGYGLLTVDADPDPVPPPDLAPRRFRGPALTLDWLQDGFAAYRDLVGMDITEDFNLRWSGQAALGLYTRAWGSTDRAPFARLALQKGWAPSGTSLLLLQASASGRRPAGGVEDGLASAAFTAYRWGLPHQVLAGYLAVDAAQRPDPGHELYLGGIEGLRGYTDHVRVGDRRWLASLEDRILTDWRWLGILRVGFVVYADAGAIRQSGGQGWSRTYADAGAGLRFGDLKSSLGRVVYLTVACPLVKEPGQDKWQVVVGNTVKF